MDYQGDDLPFHVHVKLSALLKYPAQMADKNALFRASPELREAVTDISLPPGGKETQSVEHARETEMEESYDTSIIPQEPTLFRGSVRTNLDPLGLYSDDEIWKALEKCQLKSTISELPNLLEASVSDEGENWSMGQRQLFCLGRVLLKRNKILVLDEATASIDSNTDVILQRIIREEFSKCTVITVAHRVPTVIDSDMVLVLSYGKLVEYDEPSRLMEIDSSFSKLVAEYWSSCKKK
ncbi:hypothetical protein SASPL_110069 [Salvia splendens]|uniref:ABC transporter domain-containing protein n=2 Tax=Salvia splendens TaxID=180675 RepID=A0A8X9A3V6_SALSN|nr:hypothetical protein SASPL_110069 [Salvia splendens]